MQKWQNAIKTQIKKTNSIDNYIDHVWQCLKTEQENYVVANSTQFYDMKTSY